MIAKAATNHWIPLDNSAEGAPAAANNPVQLLLIACAGCVMLDAVSILRKMQQNYHRLEIEIEGVRRETPPKIFRRLTYHMRIDGQNLHADNVRRALELSLSKYCSVTLSLDRSVRLLGHITLNGVEGELWEIPRNLEWFTDTSESDS